MSMKNINGYPNYMIDEDLQSNFIWQFCSAREAAKALYLDASTISKVCRGKNKTHGGFIFKYLNN